MANFPFNQVTTGYMADGLDLGGMSSHQITLRVLDKVASRGEVEFDPNTCTLDRFGNRVACTKMATHKVPVTFELKSEEGGKLLYTLKGVPDNTLQVAALPNPTAPGTYLARLLALKDGQIVRVVNLESNNR